MQIFALHVLAALPLFALAYAIFGLPILLLCIAISLILIAVFGTIESGIVKNAEDASARNAIAGALNLVWIGIKFGNKPMGKSIENAEAIGAYGNCLNELRKRLHLGQNLSSAALAIAKNAKSKGVRETFAEMAESCSGDEESAFGTLSKRIHEEHAYNASRSMGALQRYLTLSMVVSSVVPSFVLFSFIGYSIVIHTSIDSLVFILALLLVIPLLYSLIRVRANEIIHYYG